MSRYDQELWPIGFLVAALVALPLVGKHDPDRLVPGVPCSILTEDQVGSILGGPVRLMPTDGQTCIYASTGEAPAREVLVTVHPGTSAPLVRIVGAYEDSPEEKRTIDGLRARFEDRIAQVARSPQAGR